MLAKAAQTKMLVLLLLKAPIQVHLAIKFNIFLWVLELTWRGDSCLCPFVFALNIPLIDLPSNRSVLFGHRKNCIYKKR